MSSIWRPRVFSEGFSLVAVVFHKYRNDISTPVERYESRLKTTGIERRRS